MIVFFLIFEKSSLVRDRDFIRCLQKKGRPFTYAGHLSHDADRSGGCGRGWYTGGPREAVIHRGLKKRKMRILYDRGKWYRTSDNDTIHSFFFPTFETKKIFIDKKKRSPSPVEHREIITNSEIIVLIKMSVNGRTLLFFLYREIRVLSDEGGGKGDDDR